MMIIIIIIYNHKMIEGRPETGPDAELEKDSPLLAKMKNDFWQRRQLEARVILAVNCLMNTLQ